VRAIALALFALLLSPLAVAQTFSSLEERMTESDFRAAGLHKLSPDELSQLNEWLRSQAGSTVASVAPTVTDRRGMAAPQAGSREPIVTRISGEFRGWSTAGDRFELDNGQVWELTGRPTNLSVNLHNPVVRITPGLIGGWFLQVDGYNAQARVKRIR
jgi:hypothetical protein